MDTEWCVIELSGAVPARRHHSVPALLFGSVHGGVRGVKDRIGVIAVFREGRHQGGNLAIRGDEDQ